MTGSGGAGGAGGGAGGRGGWWEPHRERAGPRPIGESLGRVTDSLGMPTPSALEGVFGRWAEVVGEQVAAHARPLSLKEGVLAVGVDQPGWATQLRYLEADLLARLATVVGEGVVSRIEVRVRPP
jgi:predicted nucleic acid-binding Zn ribbon protein